MRPAAGFRHSRGKPIHIRRPDALQKLMVMVQYQFKPAGLLHRALHVFPRNIVHQRFQCIIDHAEQIVFT